MTILKLGIIGMLGSMTIAAPAAAQTVFGLTDDNRIVTFNAVQPGTIITNAAIAGLPTGTTLTGIDIRPATGEIYTVSMAGTIFRLAQSADGYSAISTGQLTNTVSGAPLSPGSNVGFDFNPVPDRLRLINAADQNFRINVSGGATIVDGLINDGTGLRPYDLIGAAYTNSFAGTTSTTLYGIDALSSSLVRSTDPNAGTYVKTNLTGTPFLPLGFSTSTQPQVGFDILFSGGTNSAFLSANNLFYSLDLTSGLATSLGTIGQTGVRGITVVAAVPEPATWALMIMGFGIVGIAARRRRKATFRVQFN